MADAVDTVVKKVVLYLALNCDSKYVWTCEGRFANHVGSVVENMDARVAVSPAGSVKATDWREEGNASSSDIDATLLFLLVSLSLMISDSQYGRIKWIEVSHLSRSCARAPRQVFASKKVYLNDLTSYFESITRDRMFTMCDDVDCEISASIVFEHIRVSGS